MTTPANPPASVSASSKEAIVALLGGQQLRGFVPMLNPQKPSFQLQTKDASGKLSTVEIRFDQLKMLGYLRKAGSPEPTHPPSSRVVTIRFTDGQVIRGLSENPGGSRAGMFVVPLRAETLERVYIPLTAVSEVLNVERLGDILVAQGAVTAQQVAQAVERQEHSRVEPLGEILVKNRAITQQQLAKGLSIQQYSGTRKLGEILLEQHFLEQDQIDEALEVQKTQRRKRFGEILVEMGFATHKTIAIALAIQCGVPFVDLTAQSPSGQLASRVPAAFARRWQIMPLSEQQGVLTVAVTDPIEHQGVEELRKTTGLAVVMVIATPQDITQVIGAYYGKAR